MIVVSQLFNQQEASELVASLSSSSWEDGAKTAMGMAADVKNNNQADSNDPKIQALANRVLGQIGNTPDIVSAALPHHIFPPVFNRYSESEEYGYHVDAAIMRLPNSQNVMRSDVSMTLFLSDPETYEGGELVLRSDSGEQAVKLPAGYAVVYPSRHLHKVNAVTKGTRIAAVTWMQSMIADPNLRDNLYQMDKTIQELIKSGTSKRSELDSLNNVYHNLIRQFAII